MHACNPSTAEVEAGRSSSGLQLHSKVIFCWIAGSRLPWATWYPSSKKKKKHEDYEVHSSWFGWDSGEYIRKSHGWKTCTLTDLLLTSLNSEWLMPGVNPTEGSWCFPLSMQCLTQLIWLVSHMFLREQGLAQSTLCPHHGAVAQAQNIPECRSTVLFPQIPEISETPAASGI